MDVMAKVERAFRKGLQELRVKDVAEARAKIAAVLGVTTKQSMTRYSLGRANLDVVKAAQIAEIFRQYGVENCWGK